jgi:exodeoxyribonuclease-5
MSITPTPDQKAALEAILAWYAEGGALPLTLGGYAGTGKTTLLRQVALRMPRRQIVYASYTGKAVSVMRSKLPPGAQVSTLHRLLYTPFHRLVCKESGDELGIESRISQRMEGANPRRTWCDKHKPTRSAELDKDGDVQPVELPPPCTPVKKLDWSPNPNPLEFIDLVVVDEASMVTDKIWKDLTKYGVPVLAVGDHGQLPPIKSEFNLMANPQIRLEKIVRQVADSPIIQLSIRARHGEHIRQGDYGDGVVKIPRHKMGRMDLDPESPEEMIIVGYNNTRNEINEMLRRQCGRSGPPARNDVVICLRNSYENGVFNGMRGRIANIDLDPYRGYLAEIDLFGEEDGFIGVISEAQFGQRKTLTDVNRRTGLWDYGYALTCHKAQGSQADKVLVIEERLPSANDEYQARWLYTAITRAAKQLILVGA